MTANQPPWPREWLMTDERMGERLWPALDRVPSGTGGVVLRHYSLDSAERLALGRRVATIARDRGLTLAVARDVALADALHVSLVHHPDLPTTLPFSRPVHDEQQAVMARDEGASLVFVSPVYPTSSHPGAMALGVEEAIRLAALAGCPAIALGGMDATRFAAFNGRGFLGYAGIGCWLRT